MEDHDLDFLAGLDEAEKRAEEKAGAVDAIYQDDGEQECDGCKI